MAPDIWFPNLGIQFQNVGQIAFTVFGISIYWYALFIVSGISMGYLTASREVERTGQNPEDYMDLLFIGVIFAIIGLRLFYVAFNWELYSHDPIRIITGIRDGGLAIFGGIIAAIAAVYLIALKKKLNVWQVLDTCAPSFAIGQMIGRWGNFFNREAFGGFTDNLFAMRIIREQAQIVTPELLANTIIYEGVEYIQVHPTFLYESIWSLTTFVLLTLYRPNKKFNGEVFWMFLFAYGLGRFFIEGLRVDQLMMGAIPVSQLMAASIFIIGAAAIIFKRISERRA